MIESLKLIRWILFICFLCQGLDSMCQMRGIVYDAENGNPISGVYIYCDSGQTISISDGSFEINCKNGLKIFFSYLGYQTDSLLITEVNDEIKFYLKASSTLLNQVVIKGPLLETNYFKQPASIVSLSNKQIKSSRAISFIDQLNQLPGIFAQTGTFNTNRITIRGIGSRTPFGTNRIRALYDDIPLTSGEGFTSLEDIDPSMIKNINIIKGSKSAVYGSGLGGIILIKGQDYFEEGIHGELGMEAGDYSYIKPSAKLSYRKNNFFITAGFSKTKTNGWRENNSFDRIAFHINSKYKTKKFETSILMYSADVNAQIPSSLSEETFLNSPEKAATNWLAVNGFEDYKRTLIGWNSKWSIHQNLAINFTLYNHRFDGYESRPFNILDDDSSQLGVRTNIQYSINRLKFRMGMEWAEENYNWQIFDTNAGEQGSLISEYKEKRKPKNYYLSASYSSPTGITVEAGLSYNRLNYEIEDLSQGDFNFSGEFKYEPILSPFAGINIPIKNQHRLFASVGHGFSYPTVEETLLQTGINPDLKPEMGWTFEIGDRWCSKDQRFFLDLTAFYIEANNFLLTERPAEDFFTGKNAGKTSHKGIELGYFGIINHSSGNSVPEFSTRAALSLNKHQFEDYIDSGIDYKGQALPGIPWATFYTNLNIEYEFGFSAKFEYYLFGKQYLNDDHTDSYGPNGYGNLRLAYRHHWDYNSAQVYLGINNIFDQHYASMILVNAPSFGGPRRYYYPGQPMNFYAGFSFDF